MISNGEPILQDVNYINNSHREISIRLTQVENSSKYFLQAHPFLTIGPPSFQGQKGVNAPINYNLKIGMGIV